ncbi:ABC transporter ATP-binding protein [Nesterenkonia pannonica]|uniref:oligopeptide/dipeptide ABC transporter ATP-binding protein n=1 Tax=Nesterenkonia pannonica TaxID=1548602 RepID=UPI002164EDD0|nr:ABC transporter ATP-binding protein [Nesterenkonia pannonica]
MLIQAQVLNLFEELRQDIGLAYLFIAHDLATVKQISDSVAVMHLGQLAEIGPAETIYDAPRHPYTRALLDSIPILNVETGEAKRPVPLKGDPPSPLDPRPAVASARAALWRRISAPRLNRSPATWTTAAADRTKSRATSRWSLARCCRTGNPVSGGRGIGVAAPQTQRRGWR